MDGDRPFTRQVLFRGRDLCVVRVGGFGSAACVVTFTSFTDVYTLDREGFGEGFLRNRGIDAVHVITRDNTWYQSDETLAAMAGVRDATAAYPHVMTYGASMGGYAAIRLAGLAGASYALALSPQFSVLPQVVPFEYRWAAAARQLRPVWEPSLPLPDLECITVGFDPSNIDSRHAALFRAAGLRFTPLRLPGAGHQVAAYLQETGLLRDAVLAASVGALDARAVARAAWQRRRRSSQHWLALAGRVRVASWRLALVRHAQRLKPDNAGLLGQLGVALHGAGHLAEAVAAHRAALARAPGNPALLAELADTLTTAGDTDGALHALEEACRTVGEAAHAPALRMLRRRQPSPDTLREGLEARNPGANPPPGARPILAAAGTAGNVLFGPYLELRPGLYEVAFGVAVQDEAVRGWRRLAGAVPDLRAACVLDVAIHGGRVRLARRVLTVAALRTNLRTSGDGWFRLPFAMTDWTICEFRLFTRGVVALAVRPARPVRRLARIVPPVR